MSAFTKNLNKYFLIVIVILICVNGFQTYLLSRKSDTANTFKSGFSGEQRNDDFSYENSIRPWDPFADFRQMQERMDHFFDKDFRAFNNSLPGLSGSPFNSSFSNNLDMKDEDGKLIFELTIPNLNRTNLDVSVEGQSLKVTGDLEQKNESNKDEKFFQSRQSQHFERYLTLPVPVKPESLKVDYNNDSLIISIEKKFT
jgi:HSP20 family protein